MNLKKVHFFISSLSYGGKERQTVEMLRLLTEFYSITLYILNQKEHTFTDSSEQIKIEFKPVCGNSRNMLIRFWSFFRIIFREKPDLIHTMDAISTFFCLIPARLNGIPVVNGSIRHAGVTHGFDYIYEKLSLTLSDYVISNSYAGLIHYRLGKTNKATHIYNFIDSSRFIISNRSHNCLVMTANFTDYKDHTTALICAEKLFNEGRIERFHFIGAGPYLAQSQDWVKARGLQDKFTFWGKISNVEEVLSLCSIGILCSTKKYKEGISNSILEYMGSGLLAIASDIGGTSEIIEHKINGLLFEVENPQSLHEAIIWALDNPGECVSMVKNGLDTIQAKFSPQSNCKQLQAVYDRFLK